MIFPLAERVEMVRGCRWVDEVVPNVPYIMNEEYLAHVIDKYKIDYVVHGKRALLICLLRVLAYCF